MKIGIESQRIFRSHKHGMDVVAVELIRHLQMLNTVDQFTVFAKNGPDKQCLKTAQNFKIALVKGITYGDWEQLSLPRALKKWNPDFIHCTANTAPVRCPVPLVLTLHDIIFLRETNFKGTAYQNFGNLYRRMVVPSAIKNAQTIITVSEEEKKIIIGTGRVDPAKLVVIHNAVDERFSTSHSQESLREFRKKYLLPDQFILHLGNTAPKKNTPRLIEAYIEYLSMEKGGLPLVIVDYPATLVKKKLEEIGKQQLFDNFILPGYVPSQEMPMLYACANVFVYPSLLESFGLPLLEAMSSGAPVITSEVPALREVGGNAAMFVDPLDTLSIATALHDMLHKRELRDKLIDAGKARARTFTWQKSAEKLMDVYRKMK